MQATSSSEGAEHAGAGAGSTNAAGRFVYPDGSVYEGEYTVIGGIKLKHGRGKYADGHASYQGEWKSDKMEGKGLYIAASGATFDGQFADNQFHGFGIYKWADGADYRGNWVHNKMHGEGTYTGPDGLQFVGTFYNGLYVEGKTHVALR